MIEMRRLKNVIFNQRILSFVQSRKITKLQLLMLFEKFLNKSNRKPNKIWVDKGYKLYKRSIKSWLAKNDIEIYSTHNEGKSVIAERSVVPGYHSTIKMKPIDVNSNTYIDSGKESNDKNPKFKIGDYVRLSTYKNVFAKGCAPNWSEEVFAIKKVKILCRGHVSLMVLIEKKLLERFTKMDCKKQIKNSLNWKSKKERRW